MLARMYDVRFSLSIGALLVSLLAACGAPRGAASSTAQVGGVAQEPSEEAPKPAAPASSTEAPAPSSVPPAPTPTLRALLDELKARDGVPWELLVQRKGWAVLGRAGVRYDDGARACLEPCIARCNDPDCEYRCRYRCEETMVQVHPTVAIVRDGEAEAKIVKEVSHAVLCTGISVARVDVVVEQPLVVVARLGCEADGEMLAAAGRPFTEYAQSFVLAEPAEGTVEVAHEGYETVEKHASTGCTTTTRLVATRNDAEDGRPRSITIRREELVSSSGSSRCGQAGAAPKVLDSVDLKFCATSRPDARPQICPWGPVH